MIWVARIYEPQILTDKGVMLGLSLAFEIEKNSPNRTLAGINWHVPSLPSGQLIIEVWGLQSPRRGAATSGITSVCLSTAAPSHPISPGKCGVSSIHIQGPRFLDSLEDPRVRLGLRRHCTDPANVNYEGDCEPSQFTFRSQTWDKVVAQAYVTVKIKQYYGTVFRAEDTIKLQKGLECKYSDMSCMDVEEGYMFMEPLNTRLCFTTSFDVLYEGQTTRQESGEGNEKKILFSVQSNGMLFVLMIDKSVNYCDLLRTPNCS
ncbi:hypothetical protein J437_LFUL019087 [Ladona fulva]|uniref:Uncharacterized protein n=1 Tax=Ladona fulva TaxID=123851 RepID=A0A8K0KT41_LADFU|nr:hypothetical protein J437_LFUL019087 [Ladona fulva]